MTVSSIDQISYVYILTNPGKTTLYIGVTNNLAARLAEHWDNRNSRPSFAGRYFCYNLIYYETFPQMPMAIAREKQIKKWSREKKEALINLKNPEWIFFNEQICGQWPPVKTLRRF